MTTTAVLSPSSVVMRAARGSDGVALARLAAPRLQAPRRAARSSSPRSTARSPPRSSSTAASSTPTRSRPPPPSSRCSSCTRAGPPPARPPRPGRAAAPAPRATCAGGVSPTTTSPHPSRPARPLPARRPARPAGRSGPGSGSSTSSGARRTSRSASSSRPFPPFLSAGARFGFAGAAMLAFLAVAPRRRRAAPDARGAALLPRGRHAADGRERGRQRRRGRGPVEHGRAADRLRAAVGDPLPARARRPRRGAQRRRGARRLRRRRAAAPARRADRRRVAAGLLACVGAAAMWAGGSVASPRLALPRDPFVSGAWQMLLGGAVCALTGALAGEFGDLHPAEFSTRSVARARLPGRVRLLARLHRLRLAAAERTGLQGRHLRLRQPGRGDRARLGDPRRGGHPLTFAGAAIIVASVAAVVRMERAARTLVEFRIAPLRGRSDRGYGRSICDDSRTARSAAGGGPCASPPSSLSSSPSLPCPPQPAPRRAEH